MARLIERVRAKRPEAPNVCAALQKVERQSSAVNPIARRATSRSVLLNDVFAHYRTLPMAPKRQTFAAALQVERQSSAAQLPAGTQRPERRVRALPDASAMAQPNVHSRK